MIIFFALMICGIVIFFLVFRSYERAYLIECGVKRGICPFLSGGLWIYDFFEKKHAAGLQRCKEWSAAVHIREDTNRKLRLQGAKQICYAAAALMLASVIGIIACMLPEQTSEIHELSRPEFGTTKRYEITVESDEISQQEMIIEVEGKEPGMEEMQAVFDEAFASVQTEILGENASLEAVRSNLQLCASTLYGIRTSWKSLTPEILDDLGRIIADEIPDSGILGQLQVKMTYAAYTYYYEINVMVFPPERTVEYLIGQIAKEMDLRNDRNRSMETVLLPEEIDGQKLNFFWKKQQPYQTLCFLILMFPIILMLNQYQKLKESYTKRNRQLKWDYPELVFELGILVQCGMTMNRAWERMVREYEDGRRRGLREKRFLYEEMIITRNQIIAGQSEGAAYCMFGKRCGDHNYVQLGNCLEQNLRQGTAGLSIILDQQLSQALEIRKQTMLQEGERMEMKMLIPLFILLGLVMAILMIPAFMSI